MYILKLSNNETDKEFSSGLKPTMKCVNLKPFTLKVRQNIHVSCEIWFICIAIVLKSQLHVSAG